jgi:hypothetical protein
MADPANQLTWEIDDDGLDRADARALRKAVDASAHWLEVWNSYVLASLARPVTLIVARHDGDEMLLTVDQDNARVRIAVPQALPVADLPYQVFAGAVQAVEAAAQLWPPVPPPTFWQRPETEETDEEPGPSGAEWELLEPEEMLLHTNYDYRVRSIGRQMSKYIWDRVAETGIAEVVDTSGQEWTIELQ